MLVSITASCQKWPPASSAVASSREKSALQCEFCKRLKRGRMDTLFWLAVATVVIVLFFDYTNGFHDAANIVATIIASRAMTPAQRL